MACSTADPGPSRDKGKQTCLFWTTVHIQPPQAQPSWRLGCHVSAVIASDLVAVVAAAAAAAAAALVPAQEGVLAAFDLDA